MATAKHFADVSVPYISTKTYGDYTFNIHAANDSLYLEVCSPKDGRLSFRMAYSPAGDLELIKVRETDDGFIIDLNSLLGEYTTKVIFPLNDDMIIRYTTSLKPAVDLLIPYWPRDIVISGKDGKLDNTSGKVHVSQEGTRSGMVYFSNIKPKAGSVLYCQNLTALADYCEQTQTSAGNTVGGSWPELGFALPVSVDTPLKANKKIVLSDAFVLFSPDVPVSEPAVTTQFMDMLAKIYLRLPKPDTKYHEWPQILDKGLKDLAHSPGCWSQVQSQAYLNAYISDYATPPEIMVQLAVLLPLLDYVEWSGSSLEMIRIIREGLPAFYSKELGTVMRWLPAAADKLEGEEEQKKPLVMDSWYLHHPLLNLSRMALKGDEMAKGLFLDSLGYAIKVARHFNYQWPVFYKMDTLEIVKAETTPGKGGEKDVPGLYAHIMLQAYELTGKKRYLQEAERSAKKLQGLGFELFYQANNTAFSAGAMLRLHKITGNKLYLDLSYLCLANIFRNVQLWDCNYGNGKHFPSFFALFPLSNAPYTACYEEQEVFCAFHDFLKHAEDIEILPSLALLVAEYIRYLVHRAVYYYPPMLPKEILSEEVKIGELAPKLWIALEDMQDGWEKSGQVGQEVYGAGNAFGILPRHFMKVEGEDFMVYVDYPTSGFSAVKGKPIKFKVLGNNKIKCRVMVIKAIDKTLPHFTVTLNNANETINTELTDKGHLEFMVTGNQTVKIDWKK